METSRTIMLSLRHYVDCVHFDRGWFLARTNLEEKWIVPVRLKIDSAIATISTWTGRDTSHSGRNATTNYPSRQLHLPNRPVPHPTNQIITPVIHSSHMRSFHFLDPRTEPFILVTLLWRLQGLLRTAATSRPELRAGCVVFPWFKSLILGQWTLW